MKLSFVLCLSSVVISCQSGFVPIAQRNLYEKEGKSTDIGNRRPIEEKSGSLPEIYIKTESSSIIPKETKNHTGSLFSLKNPNSFLSSNPPRGLVGDFLDVVVDVNRTQDSKSSEVSTNVPNTQQGNLGVTQNPKLPALTNSKDDLLNAIPSLEPSSASAKIPGTIKMKVIREFDNGDILIEAVRASTNKWDVHTIKVQSRLALPKKMSNSEIKTSDLVDVTWMESRDGNLTQRESGGWEDEYTMRWAGFDEARSKNALDLENKRNDLEKVKNRLEDRIVNFGKEREKVLKEREQILKIKQDNDQKINENNKILEEKDSIIEKQKEALKKQGLLIDNLKGLKTDPAPKL